jgi:hypothetical protein
VATQQTVRLVDDLDGSEAAETVTFHVDGKEYEIDLNEEHAAKLHEAFAPYVAAARRAGGSAAPRRQSAAPKRSRGDLGDVRAWLAEHGYPVKERGRIPDAWVADYDTRSPNPPHDGEPTLVEAAEEPQRRPAVDAPVFQAV